jgi:uncharacterized membrane protein YsdA (DUF1294 family)
LLFLYRDKKKQKLHKTNKKYFENFWFVVIVYVILVVENTDERSNKQKIK